MINAHSSSTTITKFLNEQLDLMIDSFYLDDSTIFYLKDRVGLVIVLNYEKLYV